MTSHSDQAKIPIIDISTANEHAPEQLLSAAARYGFVFVENNDAGIPQEHIDGMFGLSKDFFSSPLAVKETVSIKSNKAGKNHGWLGRDVEKLDPATQVRSDVKEAFNIGEPLSGGFEQPMPSSLQAHVAAIVDFQRQCHELCLRLLEHFAVALGIDKPWFTSRHDRSKGRSGTVFRLLYYPHVDTFEDGVDIRAGAHSDYGSVTLLFQQPGQPGLEMKTPSGDWAAVPVDPYLENSGTVNGHNYRGLPILVNIGDLLEDWTGGLLKSTVHRVIFPKEGHSDRYSIAYFCHPLDNAVLEPVPSRLVQDHAAETGRQARAITAKDHLMERLAATYKVKTSE